MAKQKLTADSFLFEANRGKKWNIIHRHFGNDGIVMWITLLQELCSTDNHFIIGNKVMIQELAELSKVSVPDMYKFLDFVSENFPDHFNTDLWFNYRIIRNDKLIEQLISDLYSKRTNKPLTIKEITTKYKLIENKQTKENISQSNLIEENKTKENITQLNLTKGKDRKGDIKERNDSERIGMTTESSDIPSKSMFSNEMLDLVKSKKDDEFSKWYLGNLVDTFTPITDKDVEYAFQHYISKVKDQPKFIGIEDLQPLS